MGHDRPRGRAPKPTTDSGNRCAKCGYDLTGLTEPRCPECGKRETPGWLREPGNDRLRGRCAFCLAISSLAVAGLALAFAVPDTGSLFGYTPTQRGSVIALCALVGTMAAFWGVVLSLAGMIQPPHEPFFRKVFAMQSVVLVAGIVLFWSHR